MRILRRTNIGLFVGVFLSLSPALSCVPAAQAHEPFAFSAMPAAAMPQSLSQAACLVSSSGWANSSLPQIETGNFQIQFDATPSAAALDSVVGLSSGPATAYTDLAAIVRFNNAGNIDARNGSAYTSLAPIPYLPGGTYHITMNINVAAHTYDAYVLIGSGQTPIGTGLAFRTDQASVSSLGNIASVTSTGSNSICNMAISSGCLSSSGSWVNSTLPLAEAGSFQVSFNATPLALPIDSVVGLSSGPASAYTDLAAIVRFNSTGTIDARNGSAYTSLAPIPYEAGVTYQVTMNVNVAAHTYDAYVLMGSVQAIIGTGLAFRTEQASVSSLNNLGAVTSTSTNTVCDVMEINSGINSGTATLTSSSSSLSFGNVPVSGSSSQTLTLTNSGSANVTISNVTVAGAGFNASGIPVGTVLLPGQVEPLVVTFAPAATGSASGTITVTSNASNSPGVIALSGTSGHSVVLSWVASTSAVVGYNVYAGGVSGGPYSKLTTSPVATTSYTDSSTQSGQTRYYVVTSVSASNVESAYSNQTSATIP
jgi:Abnormal spindle-like microcephaly-assoc'd, ASPM-SPD-2-Hydin